MCGRLRFVISRTGGRQVERPTVTEPRLFVVGTACAEKYDDNCLFSAYERWFLVLSSSVYRDSEDRRVR
jgi:hypothetical protein